MVATGRGRQRQRLPEKDEPHCGRACSHRWCGGSRRRYRSGWPDDKGILGSCTWTRRCICSIVQGKRANELGKGTVWEYWVKGHRVGQERGQGQREGILRWQCVAGDP